MNDLIVSAGSWSTEDVFSIRAIESVESTFGEVTVNRLLTEELVK